MKHLVTPRLLMRPFTESDLGDLYSLYSDIEVMKYITSGIPRTLEETKTALDRMIGNFTRDGYGMFAIFERKEKRFIGRCGLQPLDSSGLIELGYTLIPSAWGKGFATEASMEVLRSAFSDWGLEKIVAIAVDENRASTRVMEKLGMSKVGHDRFYNKNVLRYEAEKPVEKIESIFQNSFRRQEKVEVAKAVYQ